MRQRSRRGSRRRKAVTIRVRAQAVAMTSAARRPPVVLRHRSWTIDTLFYLFQEPASFKRTMRSSTTTSGRREFLRRACAFAGSLGAGLLGAPAIALGRGELRIDRVQVQEARGRRLT